MDPLQVRGPQTRFKKKKGIKMSEPFVLKSPLLNPPVAVSRLDKHKQRFLEGSFSSKITLFLFKKDLCYSLLIVA